MSHFTVLVIGETPEDQLQPFHEYECTGIKDEHVVFVENAEYSDELNGKKGHWTNPNAKWDWYSLGGRWAGFFTVKKDAEVAIQGHHRAKDFAKIHNETVEDLPEIKVDRCLKRDLDIDRMRLEERMEAIKDYTAFITALGDEPLPPKWSEFTKEFSNINDARTAYHAIKGVQNLHGYFMFEDFLTTEDQYVNKRVQEVLSTHAILMNGKWYERGEMGWFGIVHDEKESEQWEVEFNKLFDSLPDDTLLSLYDCHI